MGSVSHVGMDVHKETIDLVVMMLSARLIYPTVPESFAGTCQS